MSFLAGRSLAKENSFFLHESKLAAALLAEKLPSSTSGELSGELSGVIKEPADILPEILRHSVPINTNAKAVSEPSLSTSSKWFLKNRYPSSSSSSISSDGFNPLSAIVSLPQATFGPRRWELPNEQPTFSASTANELRRDRYPPLNPEKLNAFASGFSQIGKAFAAATVIVFGGATAAFVYTAHKLQIESISPK